MAKRPSPPAVVLSWNVNLLSLAREGDMELSCPRCHVRMVATLPAMRVTEPANVIPAECNTCGVGFSVTLCPPAAVRPSINPRRQGAWIDAAPPADPIPPPPRVADPPAPQAAAGQLQTLAEWQQQGIGLELHPSTAAAVPRASDERPGRRDQRGYRLYSRSEITAAVQRHHAAQHPTQQPPTSPATSPPQEGDE
jgi:hypothetical protein